MEKSVINIRVEPEAMERLKHICKAEERSQARMIQLMIKNWPLYSVANQDIKPSVDTPDESLIPKDNKPIKTQAIKPIIKSSEPTKAELLKQMLKGG